MSDDKKTLKRTIKKNPLKPHQKKEKKGPTDAELLREKRAERKSMMDAHNDLLLKLSKEHKAETQRCLSENAKSVKELKREREENRQKAKDRLNTIVTAARTKRAEAMSIVEEGYSAAYDTAQAAYDGEVKIITDEHHELMKVPWEQHKTETVEADKVYAETVEAVEVNQAEVMTVVDKEVSELELKVFGPPKKKIKVTKTEAKPAPQGECVA